MISEISAQELRARQAAGEQPHLLDVREPDERQEFNIGGTHLPLGQVMAMQTDDIEDWKDEEVIVYCKGGVRSMQAAMMLTTMGFRNVKNLTGGVMAWKAGMP